MWTVAPALLAVGFLWAADAPTQDDLEGTWTITTIEQDGKKQEEKSLAVTFGPARYVTTSADGFTKSKEGDYKVDPGKSPKEIILTPADGPNKGKAILGIYKQDGDRLQACYDPTGAGRPLKFAADAGTNYVLVTYEKKAR